MADKDSRNIKLHKALLNAIGSISVGSVELLIQNSKIVQLNICRWYTGETAVLTADVDTLLGEEAKKPYSQPEEQEKEAQRFIVSLIKRAETIEHGSITLRLGDSRVTATEINEKIRLI